jgi:hypothetical protein
MVQFPFVFLAMAGIATLFSHPLNEDFLLTLDPSCYRLYFSCTGISIIG